MHQKSELKATQSLSEKLEAKREEKRLIVDFALEASSSQVTPHLPYLSSHQAGWNGIYLECFSHLAHEVPEFYSAQHLIGIATENSSPVESERKLDGRFQQEHVLVGDVCICPANRPHWRYSRTEDGTEESYFSLSLDPSVLAHCAYESIHPSQVELVPHFTQSDPLIYQIGLALRRVLQTDPQGSRFYAESMATALSAHMLQYYSTQKPKLREYTGGLPKYKLRQVIDYIDAHLDQNLGMTELADLVQMSPHYFARLFKQSMGFAPHQYVIRCRVERAKHLLLQGKQSIAQVAYNVGFAHQSHLNRHFKRWLGFTPKVLLEKERERAT